jgi:hypothetical protein
MFKTLDEIPTLSQELCRGVSSAIETIVFLSVEEYGKDENDTNNNEYVNGSILIKTEPAIYSFEITAPEALLESISTNITVPGTESESEGGIVIDVLLELVNTISGSLMRSLEPLTGAFTLEIPEFEIGKPISQDAFIVEKYKVDDTYKITVAITKI